MGLACLQVRGSGEYQGTSVELSHRHCRGETKRSGWLFDPSVCTPVHILTWSQKPSTEAALKLQKKSADPHLVQCHRMVDGSHLGGGGGGGLYRQNDGKVSLLPTND